MKNNFVEYLALFGIIGVIGLTVENSRLKEKNKTLDKALDVSVQMNREFAKIIEENDIEVKVDKESMLAKYANFHGII